MDKAGGGRKDGGKCIWCVGAISRVGWARFVNSVCLFLLHFLAFGACVLITEGQIRDWDCWGEMEWDWLFCSSNRMCSGRLLILAYPVLLQVWSIM